LQEVIERDAPVLDRELVADGRVYLASYFPVRDDDLVGAAVIDITARRRAEAARERLQAATAAFAAAAAVPAGASAAAAAAPAACAAAATVPEVASATVAEARAALETEGAALLLLEGEQLVLASSRGLSDEAVKRLTLLPLHAPRPIATAVRTGRAVEVR